MANSKDLILFGERDNQMFSGRGFGQEVDHFRDQFPFPPGPRPWFAIPGKDLEDVHFVGPFFFHNDLLDGTTGFFQGFFFGQRHVFGRNQARFQDHFLSGFSAGGRARSS
jgi:hypothetical protein